MSNIFEIQKKKGFYLLGKIYFHDFLVASLYRFLSTPNSLRLYRDGLDIWKLSKKEEFAEFDFDFNFSQRLSTFVCCSGT